MSDRGEANFYYVGFMESKASERNGQYKHGAARKGNHLPEYNVFIQAKERCTNPNNPAFENYGGRGIEFKFPDFPAFIAELGYRPSSQYTLDRENNNGHYEPGNVRWVTRLTQNRNRRNVKIVTALGRTQSLSEWAEQTGLPANRLWERIYRDKWCEECAVSIRLHSDTSCLHRPGIISQVKLTHNGKTQTAVEWAKESQLRRKTILQRIYKKWCESCAVSKPIGGRCEHKEVFAPLKGAADE